MPRSWSRSSDGIDPTTVTSYDTGPHRADYTSSLEQYNIYTERWDPPDLLMENAQSILNAPCLSSMDDLKAREITRLSRALRPTNETGIIDGLAGQIFPFWALPPSPLVKSSEGDWNEALDLPRPTKTAIFPQIPVPQPDASFSINPERELTLRQRLALERLKQDGMTYTQPDQRAGWLPCFTIEFKAAATKGNRYVGTDQANLAGSVMLHTFHQLHHRAYPDRHFVEDTAPRFFSIVIDHEIMAFNVHWMGRQYDDFTTNIEQIDLCRLRFVDDVKRAYRQCQNIATWAAKTHVSWVKDALDRYQDRLDGDQIGMPPPLRIGGPLGGFKRRRFSRGRGSVRGRSNAGRSSGAGASLQGRSGAQEAGNPEDGKSHPQRLRRDSVEPEGSSTSNVAKKVSQP